MTKRAVAIQNPEQGVHGVNSSDTELPVGVSWEDVRMFLAVVDAGSLRAGATAAGVSVNTARARISRFEEAVGASLIVRTRRGIELTPDGVRIRHLGLRMRAQAGNGAAEADRNRLRRHGELRIGASEAIGSGWLTPKILELQRELPELTMSLFCDYDLEKDRSDELDIGLVFRRPSNPDLVCSRLATLHFLPFASRGYIAQHGAPQTIDELRRHRFVEQAAPGVQSGYLDQLIGTDRPAGFLPLRTNSSLALFWAVADGAGIAFMPTYVLALTKKMVPLELPFRLRFDLFFYYHPEARDTPAIRSAIAWLRKLFDPEANPWFRAEFVHPSAFFSGSTNSDNVVQLFEPLIESRLSRSTGI